MAYQIKFPLGMLFKKMYCCKCGNKLSKKRASNFYKRGDEGYKTIILGGSRVLDKNQQIDNLVYYCEKCNVMTDYDEQMRIAKIQKKLNKTILLDNELK